MWDFQVFSARHRGYRLVAAIGMLVMACAGEPAGSMQSSKSQASDLVVIGRVIGMVDIGKPAATPKTLALHSLVVERTIQGTDETGIRLQVLPNGERWIDGQSYVLWLRRPHLRVLEAIPGSSLEAGSPAARSALEEVSRSRPVVAPQRVIWVRHETGSTGQVRMEFWMAADGAFEYRSQPATPGAAAAPLTALAGRLPATDAAALVKRLRSAGAGPSADDAGVVTIRLVGEDRVPEFREYSTPDSPPAAEVLREIGELAHKYGRATKG
jgi:hypothetical protein